MSPITAAPTDRPLEAPNAWNTRHVIKDGIDPDSATPREPKQRQGIETRKIGLRPSYTSNVGVIQLCYRLVCCPSQNPEYVAHRRLLTAPDNMDKLTAKLKNDLGLN